MKCGVVLTEPAGGCSETPDAIGWMFCGNVSILIECKTSRSDFIADRKKWFRQKPDLGIGTYRYYMTTPGLLRLEELPSSWGLMEVSPKIVRVVHHAERQDRNAKSEMALLWSECRKIQIVDRGGKLLPSREGNRVMEAFN